MVSSFPGGSQTHPPPTPMKKSIIHRDHDHPFHRYNYPQNYHYYLKGNLALMRVNNPVSTNRSVLCSDLRSHVHTAPLLADLVDIIVIVIIVIIIIIVLSCLQITKSRSIAQAA